MVKASEDLRQEHELILLALRVLESTTSGIGVDNTSYITDLRDLVNFLVVFADQCHHGKEENLYFPALEEVGISRNGGPVGVMLHEHDLGRSYIRQMKESVSEPNADLPAFAAAAVLYIALMRNHIMKENNILFAMGDQRIPEPLQKELLERFEQHEQKVIGEGRHEELHELLEKLEKKYLH